MARSGFHTEGQQIDPERRYTVVVAPDSFKGSLDAHAVAAAIADGVRDALPLAEVRVHPVADGGEGLLDVLLPVMGGTRCETEVSGPLPGQRVRASWGFVEQAGVAIVEMAQAAGLGLVPFDRRDPRITTTYGVGELLRAALDRGARTIVVGIGGSATNDGGAGMAQALGARFLDRRGMPLGSGGAALCELDTIDVSASDPRIQKASVIVACDVENLLTGPEGATAVYGPQKGATPEIVEHLERCLERYRDVLRAQYGIDVQDFPGSGAAGGLGAGLIVFADGQLRSGIDLVLDLTQFDSRLRGADMVITGEGSLDAQTKCGKALSGVLRRARAARVPVLAVAGRVEGDPERLKGPNGFADLIGLVNDNTSSEEAMKHAAALLRERTSMLVRKFVG